MFTTSPELDELASIASKPALVFEAQPNQALVLQSLAYLESTEALESINVDAYWPKWSGPWWQMMLLFEMGLASRIPPAVIDKIVAALNQDYLRFFPFREQEVPAGRDPVLHVACHCQLGTIYQLLAACGLDVDERLPWIRPWFLQYQMKDGGLNCDEAAYIRAVPKSSVVSTLPPLEAVLYFTANDFEIEEIEFLDRGASYLIQKSLFRASSTGKPIDQEWLKLCFPRFYHYDLLRGLSFVLRWSRRLKRTLPIHAISEAVHIIDRNFPDGAVAVQRSAWRGASSRGFDLATGSWSKSAAASYPLLDQVSRPGTLSPFLSQIWSDTRQELSAVIEAGLILPAEAKA